MRQNYSSLDIVLKINKITSLLFFFFFAFFTIVIVRLLSLWIGVFFLLPVCLGKLFNYNIFDSYMIELEFPAVGPIFMLFDELHFFSNTNYRSGEALILNLIFGFWFDIIHAFITNISLELHECKSLFVAPFLVNFYFNGFVCYQPERSIKLV